MLVFYTGSRNEEPRELFELCPALLSLTDEKDCRGREVSHVDLVHASVIDYLLTVSQRELEEGVARTAIYETCVSYLCHRGERKYYFTFETLCMVYPFLTACLGRRLRIKEWPHESEFKIGHERPAHAESGEQSLLTRYGLKARSDDIFRAMPWAEVATAHERKPKRKRAPSSDQSDRAPKNHPRGRAKCSALDWCKALQTKPTAYFKTISKLSARALSSCCRTSRWTTCSSPEYTHAVFPGIAAYYTDEQVSTHRSRSRICLWQLLQHL